MILKNKISISIFIIWLFNISGILGILSTYSDWFLKLTPINLSMYVILILWNIDDFSKKVLVAFSIPFVIGFLTEFLGVNFGLIFGSYSYGDNLGLKIAGVPLIICLNWAVLTIITADLSSLIHKNTIVQSLLGGFIMMLLDIIIEVSAPRFDFWEFENSIPFLLKII
jgi:putative membrane protein